jgi:hypothetical protein
MFPAGAFHGSADFALMLLAKSSSSIVVAFPAIFLECVNHHIVDRVRPRITVASHAILTLAATAFMPMSGFLPNRPPFLGRQQKGNAAMFGGAFVSGILGKPTWAVSFHIITYFYFKKFCLNLNFNCIKLKARLHLNYRNGGDGNDKDTEKYPDRIAVLVLFLNHGLHAGRRAHDGRCLRVLLADDGDLRGGNDNDFENESCLGCAGNGEGQQGRACDRGVPPSHRTR